jgi:hypothetical protein
MNGVIVGGWEYVTAAYAATWIFFVGYAIRLFLLSRRTLR